MLLLLEQKANTPLCQYVWEVVAQEDEKKFKVMVA